MLLSIVAVCCGVAIGSAQSPTASAPYLAQVTTNSVVRSGEGDSMPETGELVQGDRVIVLQQIGEKWLAIEPPRGSVSWVRNLSLGTLHDQDKDMIPRNAVIQTDTTVEISAGRSGVPRPLDVRRVAIPDGTIVKIIGTMVDVNGVKWVPIEPPEGDMRYILKSAVVSLNRGPTAAFTVQTPAPPAPAPSTNGNIAPTTLPTTGAFQPATASVPNSSNTFKTTGNTRTKPDNWPNHPLWLQAEQAELAGDYAKAESLYLQLAREMNKTNGDQELTDLCYARVHAVREKQRTGNRTPSAVPETSKRTDTPQTTGNQWFGPGQLMLAGFRIDGRTTYALVGSNGKTKCYAIAGPGLDMERFRNDAVYLYGAVTYPTDLRGYAVMNASRVQSARP